MLRIAYRQTATVEQTGPVRLFVDGDVVLLAVCGRDHHQAISQQRFAGSRIAAISCIALVSDAAAKTVIFPSSASAWAVSERVSVAPAKGRTHERAI